MSHRGSRDGLDFFTENDGVDFLPYSLLAGKKKYASSIAEKQEKPRAHCPILERRKHKGRLDGIQFMI
jgi:hypothetical protein